jgi:hypothetical protein
VPNRRHEPDNIEKNADDDHGDGSRDKGCKGSALHHHHGAVQGIADPPCLESLTIKFQAGTSNARELPVSVAVETDSEPWR